MEKQRVNRITAVYSDDMVTMSLYKTHTRLTTLTNEDVGIKPFSESGASNKPAYTAYCKEVLINLLQNDGITGFYYDPKSQQEQENGMPRKFDANTFATWSKQIVKDTITKMKLINTAIHVSDNDIIPNITETYKDGHIKYANAEIPISIKHGDQSLGASVLSEIRSGQMTKPKKFKVGDKELGFNPTAIKSIVKGEDKGAKQDTGKSNIGTVVQSKTGTIKKDELKSTENAKSQVDQKHVEQPENVTKAPDKPKENIKKPQDEPQRKSRRGKIVQDQVEADYIKDMTSSSSSISKLMAHIKNS